MLHRGRKNQFDRMPIAEDFASSADKRTKTPAVQDKIAAKSVPTHLSDEMQAWWHLVMAGHALNAHRQHLLRLAAEAFDRCQQARKQLLKEGTTFRDKNGNLRSHPAIAVERDARTSFAKLLAQLDLDPPPDKEPGGFGWYQR
jgi:P27 family predicted phage terminase small subunit